MSEAKRIYLTDPQQEFFLAKDRFVAFVGGFGSGKSQSLFLKMLSDKFNDPESTLLYGAPTYSLIRDIAHDRLCMMLDQMPVSYNLNKADQCLHINGYGKILFRSLDRPERLVGFEISRAYLDELDTLKHKDAEEVWNKIIARIRQRTKKKTKNKIYVATTPEGYRFVYTRWSKNVKAGYRLIKAPTESNLYLPDDYVQSLRDTYPENLIEAYLDGAFVNLTGKNVYSDFDRNLHHESVMINSKETIHIGCDFNVRNMNATCHVLRGNRSYQFAELTKMKDTPQLIETVKELYKNEGHPIIMYPDATGKSNKSIDASKSDIQMLRNAKLTVRANYSNPPIKDRVQSLNAAFKEGKAFIDVDKCPESVDALEQQVYDANGLPEKNPADNIDDLNDSKGYFNYWHFPITRNQFTAMSVAI